MSQKIKGLLIFCAAIFLLLLLFNPSKNVDKLFFGLGKAKFEHNDFVGAEKYFAQALKFNLEDKDIRYYYVKSLCELKPDYEVQKKLYKFTSDKYDDSANSLATNKLREIKKDILQNIGNNYIEQAPMGVDIIRWNKESFPLRVFVNVTPDSPEYYLSACNRAMNQWEKSVDFVSFSKASRESDAQIVIKFVDSNIDQNDLKNKYITAFTTPETSGKTLKKMIIYVNDKTPNNLPISDRNIYNTVLHEMGHALGIMGHSYSSNDLMYSTQEQLSIYTAYREDFHYLSGRDVNTIKLLYSFDPTITDNHNIPKENLIYPPIIIGNDVERTYKKIEELKDYIKDSPDLSNGYVNLAAAYMDIKEYHKALNCLNKALSKTQDDNEKYIVYYDLASVYLSLGRNDLALQYARLAQNINNSDEVTNIINLIKNNVKNF